MQTHGHEQGKSRASVSAITRWSSLDGLELEWFFSRGQIAFERSTFGAMLEHQALFSVAHPSDDQPVHDACGRVIGHASVITARPTAETREPSGYTPDIKTLRNYARTSMRLKRVAAESRVAAQVLECMYGDLGQRWDGHEKYGRQGCLFHLTAKGKAMLQAARSVQGALLIADVARMEVLCAVQQIKPNAERGQALATCVAQAQSLLHSAQQCWLLVKRGTVE